jgi:antitoxin ParD1/3/4
MTKLDISLPDDVKALADQKVAGGRYPSLSEYVADLIRRDQQHTEDDPRTEAHLLQRIRSGPSQEMTDADFDRIRDRVEDQIRRRRTP